MKEELKDKDIIYLYITGETSPKGTWRNMIPDIHGEHFRVTNDQWAYLMSTFKIGGVPTYFVIDAEGNTTFKQTGFPGVDTMKEQLMKALKEVIVKYITLIIGNASIVFRKLWRRFYKVNKNLLSSSQAIQSLSVLLIYASQQSVSDHFYVSPINLTHHTGSQRQESTASHRISIPIESNLTIPYFSIGTIKSRPSICSA